MFHLFNYTFLKFDFNYDFNEKGIVLSTNKGGLVTEEVLVNTSKLLGNIDPILNTYEELVGTDKTYLTDSDFFKAIFDIGSDNNKFYIYCDSDTYNKLIVKFLKFILPNITAEYAYAIYDLNIRNSKVHFTQTGLDDLGSIKSNEVKQCYIDLTPLSKVDFIDLYNQTNLTGTLDSTNLINLKKKVSLEFLVASYLTDNNTVYKDSLESIYIDLYYQLLYLTICESKNFILKDVFRLDTLYPGIDIDDILLNPSVEDIINQEPTLSFVLDSNLSSETIKNYTQSDLNSILDSCNAIQDHYNIANLPSGQDCKEFEIVRLGTIDLDTILQSDINKDFDIRLFTSSVDTRRYNLYLLTRLYKISQSDINILQNFSLD